MRVFWTSLKIFLPKFKANDCLRRPRRVQQSSFHATINHDVHSTDMSTQHGTRNDRELSCNIFRLSDLLQRCSGNCMLDKSSILESLGRQRCSDPAGIDGIDTALGSDPDDLVLELCRGNDVS